MEKNFFPFDWHEEDIVGDDFPSYHRIEIWCLDENNESCLIRVENYKPPCFLELPDNIEWTGNTISELNKQLSKVINKYIIRNADTCTFCMRAPFFGYLNGKKPFLRILCDTDNSISKIKAEIEQTIYYIKNKPFTMKLWESDIETIKKFTVERQLSYSGWCSAFVKLVDEHNTISKVLEYTASWDSFKRVDLSIVPHPMVAAFDIETRGRKMASKEYLFPNEFNVEDFINNISLHVKRHKTPDTEKTHAIVYCNASPSEGSIMHYAKTEKEIICTFVELLDYYKIDILIGHNINGFDFKYINQRLNNFWLQWPASASRLIHRAARFVDESWETKSKKVKLKHVIMPGRISIDTLTVLQTGIVQLNSYSLNNVSKEYLGKGKYDMPYKELFRGIDEFLETKARLERCTAAIDDNGKPIRHTNVDETLWNTLLKDYEQSVRFMGQIAEYCNQDSILVMELFEKLNIWENVITSGSILEVKPKYVYTKGQKYKLVSQMYSLMKEEDIVFNDVPKQKELGKYEGALNLGTEYGIVGFYPRCASIDVNSMYPNEISANNLCTSTEITEKEVAKYVSQYGPDCYIHEVWTDKRNGSNYDLYFVKENVHLGFFPRLVRRLLSRRADAKQMLKKYQIGSIEYVNWDAIQYALKISANSVYGGLGMDEKSARFPSKHIAALVTKKGRETLLQICKFIETGGPPDRPNMLPPGEIVYGDTDSAQFMVKGDYSMENYLNLVKSYVKAVNEYIAPLKVEMDKFGDMAIKGPKQYVIHSINIMKTLMDGSPNPKYLAYGGYKYTGTINVKRDSTQILKDTNIRMIETRMQNDYRKDDPEEDREFYRIQEIIDMVYINCLSILFNKVELDKLIIYKGYNKESESAPLYWLAKRMSIRGKPINIGERIPYIFVTISGENKSTKKGQKMRMIDDIDRGEKLDVVYYVELMKKHIDGFMNAFYINNTIYTKFLERKGAIDSVSVLLRSKKLIGLNIGNNSEMMYWKLILAKFSYDDELASLQWPTSYSDFVKYKNSDEYEKLDKKLRTRITKIINKINENGILLTLAIPNIVENLLFAYNNGILREYSQIMMSKDEYEKIF